MIDLDRPFRNDAAAPDATRRAIAKIISSKPSDHWRRLFDQADCCCTIVQSIEQAFDDAHFKERGLFEATLEGSEGIDMAALPVPIAKAFRADPEGAKSAPALGSYDEA